MTSICMLNCTLKRPFFAIALAAQPFCSLPLPELVGWSVAACLPACLCCCRCPPPRYPHDAWEMLLGWDQDRFMGARAGAALVQHIRVAAGLKQQQEGGSS